MRVGRLMVACLPMTVGAGVAHAAYVYSSIADPSGNGYTVAEGINDAGQIDGFYYDSGAAQHGFLLTGGGYVPIDVPGAASTQANGINNAGTIVGYSTTGGGATTGFERTLGGSFSGVIVPASTGTNAWGINGAGTVSGYYIDGTGIHGFVDSGGTFTLLNDPNGTAGSTTVYGINSDGTVVGSYIAGGTPNGFIWSSGSGYTSLDDPLGTSGTILSGINEFGEVVGTYLDSAGSFAFVESGGSFTTLDVPMAATGFTQGLGINDLGNVVGAYVDNSSGAIVGFDAAAVPEPASFALLRVHAGRTGGGPALQGVRRNIYVSSASAWLTGAACRAPERRAAPVCGEARFNAPWIARTASLRLPGTRAAALRRQAGANTPSGAASAAGGERGRRPRELRVALQHRQHPVGEQAHVQLGLLVRQAAEGELGDQVIEPGQLVKLRDLLHAVVRRADHLDADIELGRLLPAAGVLHLGVGLADLVVRLVALHRVRWPSEKW